MEKVMHVDLHRLELRFAPLRLRDRERLARLSRSLRQHGQLMPVVGVAEGVAPPGWVLIDGYRRREASGAIGEDRVWVDVWERSVDEALLLCLGRGTERGWEAIEEAALLHELAQRHSLRELALRVGRDLSWVSRRLSLFRALPEELLAAVRSGKLSVRAATRILAPLARANGAHARTLLGALEQTPLSTRELERLFAQYQRAPQAQRERLVEHPGLFVQALQRRAEAAADRRLSEGPEGAWCQDLGVSEQILKRLSALMPTVFFPQQAPPERARPSPRRRRPRPSRRRSPSTSDNLISRNLR